MSVQAKSLNEVIWLRVFAIITLVAWHSYCSYICWGIADSPLNVVYTRAFRLIAPIAQMPLFTFLSGYLFYYLHVNCGKYKNFKGLFKNKVRRLLIPYLVLGLIINMTQLQRMHPIELFWGTPNHMWYCLMLFWCFMICWFVENRIGRWFNWILAVASFSFVFYQGSHYLEKSPFGIFMPIYFYSFFFFGYAIYACKGVINRWSYRLLPFMVTLYIVTVIWGGHFVGLAALCFVMELLIIFNKIIKEPPLWLKMISKYSFGIFVFHQWIIWNVTRWNPMSMIINDHYILFPLLLFMGVFSISLVLTHYSLKTQVGRYLLA